jgi:hypothetical protein
MNWAYLNQVEAAIQRNLPGTPVTGELGQRWQELGLHELRHM